MNGIQKIIEESVDNDVNRFLEDMSEYYADAPYAGLRYDDVIKKTSIRLTEWKCNRVDVAHAINKPCYPNGETMLMMTLRWNRDVELIGDWFLMLVKFGGNPYQKNKKGEDSFDIAKQRFKGLEDEFSMFVEEVENARKQ